MSPTDSVSPGPGTLVYGVFEADEVAFLPRRQAQDLAQLWRALDSAQTWGHFRRMLPAHVYEEVLEALQEAGDLPGGAAPDPDAPFDRDEIPGHATGDWPPLPARLMLAWVPGAIQEQYGRVASTPFNGDYLCFPATAAEGVAQALAQHGYTCTRDDDLVRDASGN